MATKRFDKSADRRDERDALINQSRPLKMNDRKPDSTRRPKQENGADNNGEPKKIGDAGGRLDGEGRKSFPSPVMNRR